MHSRRDNVLLARYSLCPYSPFPLFLGFIVLQAHVTVPAADTRRLPYLFAYIGFVLLRVYNKAPSKILAVYLDMAYPGMTHLMCASWQGRGPLPQLSPEARDTMKCTNPSRFERTQEIHPWFLVQRLTIQRG